MPLLSPGDSFPAIPLTPPGGPALTLPDAFNGEFGVMLFFRGAWCPYCNAQLRAFQRASDSLADAGTKVAALSVDDEPTTAGLIAKHGLTFPVGHSADARAIATATGAFLSDDPTPTSVRTKCKEVTTEVKVPARSCTPACSPQRRGSRSCPHQGHWPG